MIIKQLTLSDIKELISKLPKYIKQSIKDSQLMISLYLKDSLHIIFDDIYAERNLNKKLNQLKSRLNIFQFWGPKKKFTYCFLSYEDARKIGINFKRNDLTIKIDTYLRIIERYPFPKEDSIEVGAFSILIPLLIKLKMISFGEEGEIIFNLPKFQDKTEEEEFSKKIFLDKIDFQIELLKESIRNGKILILNNYAYEERNFEFESFKTLEKKSLIIEGIPRRDVSDTNFYFLYEVDANDVRSLFQGAFFASEDLEEMPLLIFNNGDLGPSNLGKELLELHLLIPQKANKYPIESIGKFFRKFLLSEWSTINDIIDEKDFRLEWQVFKQRKEPKIDKYREIIENLDCKSKDLTHFIRNLLYERIDLIPTLEPTTFNYFCNILSFIIYLMIINSEDKDFFKKSADIYWEEHRNTRKNMEVDWFQLELRTIFIKEFGFDNLNKEPELTHGKIDFKVHDIPIECKVFNDIKNKRDKEVSGLDLLDQNTPQLFQYEMYKRCGFLLAYDYRKKNIENEFLRQAISERIQIKTEGNKILFKAVFLGNIIRPSDIKS